MSSGHPGNFESLSMWELFRMEVEAQTSLLAQELAVSDHMTGVPGRLEDLTRAAHSLKGAARIVGCGLGVRIASAMEQSLRELQPSGKAPAPDRLALILRGAELLRQVAGMAESDMERWSREHAEEGEALAQALVAPPAQLPAGKPVPSVSRDDSTSLEEYFLLEVETQTAVLTEGLLALEHDPAAAGRIEELMRAAHSLKGAAQIMGYEGAVRIAHAMEDSLVTATPLSRSRIDTMLEAVDRLIQLGRMPAAEAETWTSQHGAELADLVARLTSAPAVAGQDASGSESQIQILRDPVSGTEPDRQGPDIPQEETTAATQVPQVGGGRTGARTLRITARNLDRLQGMAGEALLSSRWLEAFTQQLTQLKRRQDNLARYVSGLRETLNTMSQQEAIDGALAEVQRRMSDYQGSFSTCLAELDLFDRRFTALANRIQDEVLNCRMRPFADGVQGLARSARDLARALGKEARLVMAGESVPVDRDILERLEAPLGHLLRNALDHGVEPPQERIDAGKAPAGTVRLEARHSAGRLLIEVGDDGRGLDPEAIRQAVVRRGLTTGDMAEGLTEAELFEFLFLTGFSMKDSVTQVSGRGVGLDAVQTAVKEVGGSVRVLSRAGRGTRFQLQLPLTLSVLRALLVEVDGEPYAVPLARITSALKVPRNRIESVEGRQHFTTGELQAGLVQARQVLELDGTAPGGNELCVVVLGERSRAYGLVVDRFLGERELVVLPLDPRLGKIPDVAAAALLPDRSPVLILDVDDLMRSIENLVSGGRLLHVRDSQGEIPEKKRKRVLVVDDSLTVRELERKLLAGNGYQVEVAVDGMDGWNAVRTGKYDLVVTDVDMPRMDGIELVTLIRRDARLRTLPVMIVSYKDREEDRQRGLEAGADYYLTKGSFQDETLIYAVSDLIGPPLG